MIRLAHRVTVKGVRIGRLGGANVWLIQCPGCGRVSPEWGWGTALSRASRHAHACPDLRRLNRPVYIGEGS